MKTLLISLVAFAAFLYIFTPIRIIFAGPAVEIHSFFNAIFCIGYIWYYFGAVAPELRRVTISMNDEVWVSDIQEDNKMLRYFFATPFLSWNSVVHIIAGAIIGFVYGFTHMHSATVGESIVGGSICSVIGAGIGIFFGAFGIPCIVLFCAMMLFLLTLSYAGMQIKSFLHRLFGR